MPPDQTVGVDLGRLVAIIAEELAAYRSQPAARCACHGWQMDCCPTRVQGVVDAGAARLGMHGAKGGGGLIAGLIDHAAQGGRRPPRSRALCASRRGRDRLREPRVGRAGGRQRSGAACSVVGPRSAPRL
jgi:hypothetical protein